MKPDKWGETRDVKGQPWGQHNATEKYLFQQVAVTIVTCSKSSSTYIKR
jgi:hypothetical protein